MFNFHHTQSPTKIFYAEFLSNYGTSSIHTQLLQMLLVLVLYVHTSNTPQVLLICLQTCYYCCCC